MHRVIECILAKAHEDITIDRPNINPGVLYVYLSRKVSFWLLKIFKIQKGHTFSFNDILHLCTIVVNIAIRSHA